MFDSLIPLLKNNWKQLNICRFEERSGLAEDSKKTDGTVGETGDNADGARTRAIDSGESAAHKKSKDFNIPNSTEKMMWEIIEGFQTYTSNT